MAAGATHLLLEGAARADGGGIRIRSARSPSRAGSAGSCRSAWPAASTRRTSRPRCASARPSLVDAASGLERDGAGDPRRIARLRANRAARAGRRRSGRPRAAASAAYGGRFVPETLIPALEELERRVDGRAGAIRATAASCAGFSATSSAARPRSSEVPAAALAARGGRGASVWLKREDLAHTGAHKINNAVGQALLARRMGKPRVIAETGAGQHGVATATACALLGLECVVYMGTTDIERQAPNVRRMGLLGAEVRPVATGNGTLRDALNEALRDWVANVEDTFYVLGSAAGPHPYPEMVASLQEVIGREARAQMIEARSDACPTRSSPASAAAATPSASCGRSSTRAARLIGVEAGGRGDALGDNAASLGLGAPGVLHGAFTMLTQTLPGQVVEPHSVSAGLDYPGRRAAARGAGRGRTARGAARDRRRGARGDPMAGAQLRHHPRPRVGARHGGRAGHAARPAGRRASCSSTSPDAATRTSASSSASWPARERPGARPSAAFDAAAAEDRTALIAYVLAGYPTEADGVAAAEAALAGGADILEIGVPFSDPLADGPTIADAGRVALAAGGGTRIGGAAGGRAARARAR